MSIITEIRVEHGNETIEAQRLISPIDESPPARVNRSVRFQDSETGAEYRCLSGALVWPGVFPGYIIVVGVVDEDLKYVAVEEYEEKHLPTLLKRYHDLYERYTSGCQSIAFRWYGDNTNAVYEFAFRYNLKQGGHELLLYDPPYIEEPNQFGLLVQTIFTLAHKNSGRLSMGDCNIVRGYLEKLDPKRAHAGSIENHPAISALGYVLTGMEQVPPWEDDVDLVEMVDTVEAGEKALLSQAEEQERYWRQRTVEESSESFYDNTWVNTVE